MTDKEARLLVVGTIVMWDKNPNDLGTVQQKSPTAFRIEWKDGQDGWIDFRDARRVSVR